MHRQQGSCTQTVSVYKMHSNSQIQYNPKVGLRVLCAHFINMHLNLPANMDSKFYAKRSKEAT